MAESDSRLPARAIVRAAEAPGVRELKAEHEVIRRAVMRGVRVLQDAHQLRQPGPIFLRDDELPRVRAPVRPHGHGLRTADQFRAAFTETPPPPPHLIGHPARRRAVPAFHRLDREAIAD
jgi:hypothetical protein